MEQSNRSCDNCYYAYPEDYVCTNHCMERHFEPENRVCDYHSFECHCGRRVGFVYEGERYCSECLQDEFEIKQVKVDFYEYQIDGEVIGTSENMDIDEFMVDVLMAERLD